MTPDAQLARIDRFHQVLVDEIRVNRPTYLSSPFTVAEIYQDLVPYNTHRDRIGVEMNGDYEDLLLRLLAGEGGYLIVESDHARERLKKELVSQNPETGLYREFAAVDVRLNPDRVFAERSGPGAVRFESAKPLTMSLHEDEGEEGESVPVEFLAPPNAIEGPIPPPERVQPLSPRLVVERASVAPSTNDGASTACSWCRGELPQRENLNYCPFCGADVRVVPCPSCGEALEPDWRFCIACGAEVVEE